MKLLQTIIIIAIAYYAFTWLVGDVFEGYCSVNTDSNEIHDNIFNNSSVSGASDGCNVCSHPKCRGCTESGSTTAMCGWNNSVSSDGQTNWAPNNTMGKQRVFKYPHYYGYGTGSGFNYGEPYYVRTVDY